MTEKKSISFPPWVEALIVLALLIMAGVEYEHGQWAWAGIFGAAGLSFGISLLARWISGEKHGRG